MEESASENVEGFDGIPYRSAMFTNVTIKGDKMEVSTVRTDNLENIDKFIIEKTE